jgi:hypothetical protein
LAAHQVDAAQQKLEPTWLSAQVPEGMNALAIQFFMVLKEVGEDLFALIEAPPTLALAAELLGMDERGVGGRPNGAGGYLVVEACGCGQPKDWIDNPVGRQVSWHSDSGSKLAFRTALDPQGGDGGNAALRVLPGSALRVREDVMLELPGAAPHPKEVRLPLDETQMLVWNPTTWHATDVQVRNLRPCVSPLDLFSLVL